MVSSLPYTNGIAIIGMAGRFPGARTLDAFWQNLRDGVESISTFTDAELLVAGVNPVLLRHPRYVKAGAILDDIEGFDASFFGFSPKEAAIMDPQHRLFLESAWEALEQAGYASDTYSGRMGAFAGNGWSSYLFNNLHPNSDDIDAIGGYQTLIGNDKDFLTTRLAYKFNLKGPTYTVQTACSTSLVAIGLACQSLLNYQCDMALAGGVSIFVPHKTGYLHQEGGILSPDGHCRAFDAQAQGTVIGNGVGVVLLKRLEEAIADRDCIHAVIRGSAINNDGAAKVGYTAPSVEGQAEAIAEALAFAEVDPESITYIEAHGTGTSLGDPIELTALTQAFRASTQKQGFCAIGSVKTNIGHLDAAAGVTGLIKTVLALKHQQIPPSLHFEQPNPQFDFANSPFYVNTRLAAWNPEGIPRRAGVSSFGIGGTNAHVVLEEAPASPTSRSSRPWQLLLLSAKTESALETATANLANYLPQHPELSLADVAYTLRVGRKSFEHRRMLVCRTTEDAVTGLNLDAQRLLTRHEQPVDRAIVFMFSGQGSQYVNMGWELYQTEPIFREQVDRCCTLLKPHLGLDLRHLLYPAETSERDLTPLPLNETAYAQPALFTVEYALAQLWIAWGIQPQAMIGHSIGEYVAACLAEVFSLEDALALIATRGRLMQQLPGGAMLSISLPEAEVKSLLGTELSIAATNAPNLCVVSGANTAIADLETHLTARNVVYRRLHTSHAFHSSMMEPILEDFMQHVRQINLQAPKRPLISNVTGTWMTNADAIDPAYWARHLRQPVRFAEGIATLQQESTCILLEVGPGRTLSILAKQQHTQDAVILTSLHHPQDPQADSAFLLQTLGQLWLAGIPINESAFYAQEQRQRVPLPTYPFEHQRCWIDPPNRETESGDRRSNPLSKKPNMADWFYLPSWKRCPLPVGSQSFIIPQLIHQNEPHGSWLVFADADIGATLAQRLAQANQDATIVQPGKQFVSLSDGGYVINPCCQDDYQRLVMELQTTGKLPCAIVHLWSLIDLGLVQPFISATLLTTSVHGLSNSSFSNQINSTNYSGLLSSRDRFEQRQYLGLYSLLFLVQALDNIPVSVDPLPITVVTQNLYDVIGNERLCPDHATILGLLRVIPQEYSQFTCRTVDIALPDSRASQTTPWLDRLLAEILSQSVDPAVDPVVAYRGNHRWVQRFESFPLDETVDGNLRLRQQGVYLITGALGDVSLMLAEYLAQTVQARLVLLDHPDAPERDEWGQQKLQTIQELSPDMLFIQADVADLKQMQAAIAQIDHHFGELHGILYAAETNEEASFRPIQQTGIRDCEWHFQPKVHGLFVLESVLQGRSLDFCLLQSSLSSLVGGFAAHTAANLFMDGFAHQQNQTSSFPWISVNWEGWQFWEARHLSAAGTTADWALLPHEGVAAFQRLLAIAASQIVVSAIDLEARMAQTHQRQASSTQELKRSDDAIAPALRTEFEQVKDAPRNQIEQTIASIWHDLLGINRIGIYDNFFELGGHSLLAVQTISRLREVFQVEIPLRSLLLETPTIAGLAEVIAVNQPQQQDLEDMDQLLAEIERLSGDEVQAKLAEESQVST